MNEKNILQMPEAADGFLESCALRRQQLLAVIESSRIILCGSPKVIMLGTEAFRMPFIKENMAEYQ